MTKKERFYKLAQTNGWDFYTGNTINYRDNIGKIVKRSVIQKVELCSNTCLHASRNPNKAFIGAKIPCSVYMVEGIPIKEDKDKAGFKQLRILEELSPEKLFRWKYKEACNPVHPFKIKAPTISSSHIELLRNWASVWNSVNDSVGASVGASVRASIWNSVNDSVGASVGASVGTSVGTSVGVSVEDSVRASIEDSVRASVGVSVEDSVGASVGVSIWNSVWDSVGAYVGLIFSPCIKKWKYIDLKESIYPFQSTIDLWMQGLIASFDGKIWRLHGNKKGKIKVLWESNILDNIKC